MAAGGIMRCRSIALAVLLSAASVAGSASADPLDWNVAIDTGGIWTAELGRDQAGDIRSLIGRTKGGRYDMYSVNIIVNNMTRVELITEMGEQLPKVSLVSGRIVVKRSGWPAGADRPVETVSCFAWSTATNTYESASCP